MNDFLSAAILLVLLFLLWRERKENAGKAAHARRWQLPTAPRVELNCPLCEGRPLDPMTHDGTQYICRAWHDPSVITEARRNSPSRNRNRPAACPPRPQQPGNVIPVKF